MHHKGSLPLSSFGPYDISHYPQLVELLKKRLEKQEPNNYRAWEENFLLEEMIRDKYYSMMEEVRMMESANNYECPHADCIAYVFGLYPHFQNDPVDVGQEGYDKAEARELSERRAMIESLE